MHRIDVTPQHRAIREALTNALVHADYFGRTGVVVIREPDKVIARNPGTLRIGLDEVEAGGISDPRNETLLFMFSLVNISESAGSGFDILREGTSSAGKPDPLLEEFWNPDRVCLTLPLETSGLAEFDLPGMEGEHESVSSADADGANVGNDGGNVGNPVGNVGNPVGNDGRKLSKSENAVLDQIRARPAASAKDIANTLEISDRQVERLQRALREAGIIVRVGGTRGHWKVMD